MPIERLRMLPWLEEQIDSNQIPGLKWLNKEERIFQIPWIHAAHQKWDLEKDSPLFMRWAIHTGKYRPGEESPNPKTWKCNFRCALNSLPDIVEVKDMHLRKGSNAFRVYKMLFLDKETKALKRKNKKIAIKVMNHFNPEVSHVNVTKPGLSIIQQKLKDKTDKDKGVVIKNEPEDFPIKETSEFIQSEAEDNPLTVVTVRIGDNGQVEKTDMPIFSLDPRLHLKKYGQNVNTDHFPIKIKVQKKFGKVIRKRLLFKS